MLDFKVTNKVKSVADGDFSYKGSIEKKWQNVIYERMTSDDAQTKIFAEAESAFFTRLDDNDAPIGHGQGEFWGKLILSSCAGYRYSHDEELKKFIAQSTYRVMSSADSDGYIGSYKCREMIFRADVTKTFEKYGWKNDFCWNIWCRKYTIWGLIEAYSIIGDREILLAAQKNCDLLIDMLDDMGVPICETGVLMGTPSGSIIKPVLELYKYTGKSKYLDFALDIAKQWQDDTTFCVKIIKKSLAGIAPHMWCDDCIDIKPRSKSNPFAMDDGRPFDTGYIEYELQGKVYETLSCFEGLLELYRITGDEVYFTASKNFFDLLIRYEYNTLFSVGFNDRFVGAANYLNCITEVCDVIHFIRFTAELYKLTADSKYIDYIELAFYNSFLAGVNRDGKWGARGVRTNESHMYAKQCGFEYNHCCVNNMARTFEDVANVFAVYDNEKVYVNLYSSAKMKLHPTESEQIQISMGYGYLNNCSLQIYVDATLNLSKKLCLRIPSWSKETEIIVGDKVYHAETGRYFETTIKSGETIITCNFDKTPRLNERKYNWRFYPNTPYLASRYYDHNVNFESKDTMVNEDKATVMVGPILLALSTDMGLTKEEIFDRNTICHKGYELTAYPISTDGICAYNVSFKSDENEFLLPMKDFASAADTTDFKSYRFTVFI